MILLCKLSRDACQDAKVDDQMNYNVVISYREDATDVSYVELLRAQVSLERTLAP